MCVLKCFQAFVLQTGRGRVQPLRQKKLPRMWCERYPKPLFNIRSEAFGVCPGKFNLLSGLETTTDKRGRGAAAWSVTVSGKRRADSKPLPAHG